MIEITGPRAPRRASVLLATLSLLAGLAVGVAGIATAPPAQAAASSAAVLKAPGTLRPGRQLRSPNGNFRLVMARGGRAYLLTRWGRVMWSPKTGGHRNARLRLLASGRLEIVSRTGKRLWWARTSGRHARLVLGNNGQLRLTSGKRVLWRTHEVIKYGAHDNPYPAASLAAGKSLTAGHKLTSANGRYHARMSADGGFTVSGPNGTVWRTGSAGWRGARLTLTHGRLALRTANGVTLWSSGTSSGVLLVLGNKGKLVLDNAKGKAVWRSTKTPNPVLKPTAPAQSTSHYIRNTADDFDAMGCTDAMANGSRPSAVVLHIGAQVNNLGPATNEWGVRLSTTSTTVTDLELVPLLEQYVAGYARCMSPTGTVLLAVATNNDSRQYYTSGSVCPLPPAGSPDPLGAEGGAEWANVISQLDAAASGHAGITVAGADDIEPAFAGCVSQASAWITALLAGASGPYVFIGSADGCPATLGSAKACLAGWTQQQIHDLAYGINPARSVPLPQIYTRGQAVQWANISRAGGSAIAFGGVLTSVQACAPAGSGCTSLRGARAWNELANQLTLSTGKRSGAGAYVTDLRVD
jgi:hypothetical protein